MRYGALGLAKPTASFTFRHTILDADANPYGGFRSRPRIGPASFGFYSNFPAFLLMPCGRALPYGCSQPTGPGHP